MEAGEKKNSAPFLVDSILYLLLLNVHFQVSNSKIKVSTDIPENAQSWVSGPPEDTFSKGFKSRPVSRSPSPVSKRAIVSLNKQLALDKPETEIDVKVNVLHGPKTVELLPLISSVCVTINMHTPHYA